MATAKDKGPVFKADLKKWADAVGGNLLALARATCQTLAENVVNAAPPPRVDTGFLRGSWQPSLGGSAAFAPEGQVISMVVQQMKLGDVFSMRNNAVYAMRIEYGFVGTDKLGRKYNQAGTHFVARTVATWPSIVAAEAAKLTTPV